MAGGTDQVVIFQVEADGSLTNLGAVSTPATVMGVAACQARRQPAGGHQRLDTGRVSRPCGRGLPGWGSIDLPAWAGD
ncbi:MAG: hypothetical protein IT318_01765 [Anaerolineales bacterium]|nr:hypothetical protein [Anaerolineales bacterium]